MNPSIGRIVIYNHPGSKDGTFAPAQSPMVIQHVNEDGSVKGWVFGDMVMAFRPMVTQGDGHASGTGRLGHNGKQTLGRRQTAPE